MTITPRNLKRASFVVAGLCIGTWLAMSFVWWFLVTAGHSPLVLALSPLYALPVAWPLLVLAYVCWAFGLQIKTNDPKSDIRPTAIS